MQRHLFPAALDKFANIIAFQRFFYNQNVFNDETRCYDYVPFKKRIVVLEEIDTAGAIVMDRERIRKAQEDNDEKILEKFSFFGDLQKKKKIHDNTSKQSKHARDKKKNQMEMEFSKERVKVENDLKEQLKKKEISEKLMKKHLDLFDEKVKLEFDSLEIEEERMEKTKNQKKKYSMMCSNRKMAFIWEIFSIFSMALQN